MPGLPCGGVLPCWLQLVERQRVVCSRQLFCCGQWHYGLVQRLPCWGVLSCGLQLVERERAVRARQLLDSGQRHECFLHSVSCGDVQREQRVDCVERVLGVPCGGVLPCGLQLVERERAV